MTLTVELLPAVTPTVTLTQPESNFSVSLSLVQIGQKGDVGDVNPLSIQAVTDAQAAAAAAAGSATSAANSETATAADRAQTAIDAAATAADRVQTGLDAAATAADRTQTGMDKTATAADRVQTGLDKVAAGEYATAAATAKTAAETARDQTLTAFDNFDDRYLGTKTADPTTDNDGNPLLGGALYYYVDSVTPSNSIMKVYNGAQWVAAYASLSGALLVNNNLSDVNNAGAARSNLGLGNVNNTSDADKPISTAAAAALAGKQDTSAKNTANGYAGLDSSGLIPTSLMPVCYAQSNRIDTDISIPDGYNGVWFGDTEVGPNVTVTGLGNSTLRGL